MRQIKRICCFFCGVSDTALLGEQLTLDYSVTALITLNCSFNALITATQVISHCVGQVRHLDKLVDKGELYKLQLLKDEQGELSAADEKK